jgi:hypothetical protein
MLGTSRHQTRRPRSDLRHLRGSRHVRPVPAAADTATPPHAQPHRLRTSGAGASLPPGRTRRAAGRPHPHRPRPAGPARSAHGHHPPPRRAPRRALADRPRASRSPPHGPRPAAAPPAGPPSRPPRGSLAAVDLRRAPATPRPVATLRAALPAPRLRLRDRVAGTGEDARRRHALRDHQAPRASGRARRLRDRSRLPAPGRPLRPRPRPRSPPGPGPHALAARRSHRPPRPRADGRCRHPGGPGHLVADPGRRAPPRGNPPPGPGDRDHVSCVRPGTPPRGRR